MYIYNMAWNIYYIYVIKERLNLTRGRNRNQQKNISLMSSPHPGWFGDFPKR